MDDVSQNLSADSEIVLDEKVGNSRRWHRELPTTWCNEPPKAELGKFLVTVAVLLAAKLGCYKVTLNCKDDMLKFYNGIGFRSEAGDANFMVVRL